MNYLRFLVFIFISAKIYSQEFTKKMLINDLQFLNKAVLNAHPSQFKYPNIHVLDSFISVMQTKAPETLNYSEYELNIRKALIQVQCMHTYIKKSAKVKQKYYSFPIQVFASNDTLYVAESPLDSANFKFKKGDCINQINGKSAQEIIANLIQYHPTDGISKDFGYRVFNYNSKRLIGFYYGTDSIFKVSYTHQDKLISEVWKYKLKTIKQEIKQNDSASLSINGRGEIFKLLPSNIGYLQISSFKNRNYKSFYSKVFSTLKEKNCTNLIIDLRDNLGGNRFNACELLSHLLNESTYYDIIRPNTKIKKYLRFKERLKYFSSFIFYDIIRLHLRSKTQASLVKFHCKINPRPQILDGTITVLINGYTGSSSVILASNLKHHSKNVTFIGEQTAGSESSINGGSYPTIFLPHSKIGIQFATYSFQFDNKSNNRNGITPNIFVKPTFDSFLNQDIDLQKAIEHIKRKIQ